jgi:hypothetical protein
MPPNPNSQDNPLKPLAEPQMLASGVEFIQFFKNEKNSSASTTEGIYAYQLLENPEKNLIFSAHLATVSRVQRPTPNDMLQQLAILHAQKIKEFEKTANEQKTAFQGLLVSEQAQKLFIKRHYVSVATVTTKAALVVLTLCLLSLGITVFSGFQMINPLVACLMAVGSVFFYFIGGALKREQETDVHKSR